MLKIKLFFSWTLFHEKVLCPRGLRAQPRMSKSGDAWNYTPLPHSLSRGGFAESRPPRAGPGLASPPVLGAPACGQWRVLLAAKLILLIISKCLRKGFLVSPCYQTTLVPWPVVQQPPCEDVRFAATRRLTHKAAKPSAGVTAAPLFPPSLYRPRNKAEAALGVGGVGSRDWQEA